MKKITLYSSSAIGLLMLFAMPGILGLTTSTNITINVTTEDFSPKVWMCDSRVVMDDATAPGRISNDGKELVERTKNYAFEGEQVKWAVLVLDNNGISNLNQVEGIIRNNTSIYKKVACAENLSVPNGSAIPSSCNAKINGQNIINYSSDIMRFYSCTLTIETSSSMYGQYWITINATDDDEKSGAMDEKEYWSLNPIVSLGVNGGMNFPNAKPGTDSYSDTMLVIRNDADVSSGVMLDMFITGTDFYDLSSGGALCPVSNQLTLDHFRYFVTNGAYSTIGDDEVDSVAGDVIQRKKDAEGYVNIDYGTGFNSPNPFYNNTEILQDDLDAPYWDANILSPGAEIALTFKLSLPQPCQGDFNSGNIFFWGEAI